MSLSNNLHVTYVDNVTLSLLKCKTSATFKSKSKAIKHYISNLLKLESF